MKIANRKKKIESDKMIKETLMYIYLLNDHIVYDYNLNAVSPTIKRSMQRYGKELIHSGAIPTTRLKKDKNGLYYKVNDDIVETNKKFFIFDDDEHSKRLARIITLLYLKKVEHSSISSKQSIEELYRTNLKVDKPKKSVYRDLRLIDIAYSYYNKNK